ncbi:hypothetical protein [Bradyrhizobium macuxiense]|nr:hypothetical protein [Bradyrhizobium macuxiense]
MRVEAELHPDDDGTMLAPHFDSDGALHILKFDETRADWELMMFERAQT